MSTPAGASERNDLFSLESVVAWMRWVMTELLDIRVLVDDQLTAPVAADRATRTVWLRPGLTHPALQRYLSESALYIVKGEAAAPAFRQLAPVPDQAAVIIPFPRSQS